MDINIITYLACICFIFIFGRIFIVPLKKILKLIINSILGGLVIFLINLVGMNFGFHIGLNFFTSILVRFTRTSRCSMFNSYKTISCLRVSLCRMGTVPMPKKCRIGTVPNATFNYYSTVTDFARFRGLSTSRPFSFEI